MEGVDIISGENSSIPGSPSLQIAGQNFQLRSSGNRGDGSHHYSNPDAYLRMAPRATLEPEYENHIRMLQMGFPVPKVLECGEYEGLFYYIEASVGAQVFWHIFMEETRTNGCVSDSSFGAFLEILCHYAQAQVRNPVAGDLRTDFRKLVRVAALMEELPDLRDRTLGAFERAVDRLEVFPGAWCHRDLTAFNICERGVIDLDGAGHGYAGYDVIGALLEPDLWATDGHAYSARQREQCLPPLDAIFTGHGLPAPSAYARDFLFCKSLNTAVGRHYLPPQQQWLYNRYRVMLNEYER